MYFSVFITYNSDNAFNLVERFNIYGIRQLYCFLDYYEHYIVKIIHFKYNNFDCNVYSVNDKDVDKLDICNLEDNINKFQDYIDMCRLQRKKVNDEK